MNKITKRITLGLLAAGFLAGTLVWAGSEVHSNHMHGGVWDMTNRWKCTKVNIA